MTLQLNTEKRDTFGKKLAKFRKEGKLPAVLYGKGKEAVHFFVNAKEFKKIYKEADEATFVRLDGEGSSTEALIHDTAFDPVRGEPVHVDFYMPDMSKPIVASLEIVFDGIAPAVKEHGGILVKVVHEIELEALPKDFPHEIKVDMSKLQNIGDKIVAGDIPLANGVKITIPADTVIALVKAQVEEKEEPAMNIADIEVEKKGKKEEEGAAAEGETK